MEVKQIRPHNYIHSYTSLPINKSDKVKIVAKYLGHYKKALKNFAYLFLSPLDEIIDVIDNLDK